MAMDGSSSSSSHSELVEIGLSGINSFNYFYDYRRGSYKAMPVAAMVFVEDTSGEKPRHFLDACALCRRPLRPDRDIFMYRGNTPFCSEECRQERIEMDEATEKSLKLSSLLKRQKEKKKSSNSQGVHARHGTVVAG